MLDLQANIIAWIQRPNSVCITPTIQILGKPIWNRSLLLLKVAAKYFTPTASLALAPSQHAS